MGRKGLAVKMGVVSGMVHIQNRKQWVANGEWSNRRPEFRAVEWLTHSLRFLCHWGVGSNNLFLQNKAVTLNTKEEDTGHCQKYLATPRRDKKHSNQKKNYQLTLPGSTPSPF